MRTLDDIIPPSRRQSTSSEPEAPSSPRFRGKFPFAFVFVVLLIIAGSVGALFYFKNAEAEVTPNAAVVSATGAYTASIRVGASASTTLMFEIVTAQKVASQTVASSGSRAVTSSAQGSVTIYNTQTKAQPLVTNTRFATAAGLIFRIHKAVTVPAAKGEVPGQVTAILYADQPGSDYNVPATTFTLPGLSGSPTYTQVTAKSTNPMTGGASGNQPVVSASVESAARASLMSALEPDLQAGLASQIPEGYVLLPGAATTTYQSLGTAPSSTNGMADVKEQGTIQAIIFPRAALGEMIAKQALTGSYTGGAITLDVASLPAFSSESVPQAGDETVNFTLLGNATLIYLIDKTRIAAAIAGKDRGQAETALRNFPEVKRAVLILRPFWRTSFPEDPTEITVTVEKPSEN